MHDLDDQFAFDDDFTNQRTEDDLLDADDDLQGMSSPAEDIMDQNIDNVPDIEIEEFDQ